MSEHQLILSFSDPSALPVTVDYWLRLQQEGVSDDTALVGEVAALVDALFDIEPCNPDQDNRGGDEVPVNELGEPEPPVPEEEFDTTVASLLPAVSCLVNDAGDCEVQIRVYRSHHGEPYKLVVTNGSVLQTVYRQEAVALQVTVKEVSSVELEYPVLSGFSAAWNGTVYDSNGPCAAPEIALSGSTVYFGKTVTGRLQTSFTSEYDLVTILVKGQDGEPQDGSILAFYHGLVYALTTEKPTIDERFSTPCIGGYGGGSVTCTGDHVCYLITRHYAKNSCTGKVEYTFETEPVESVCAEDWCFHGNGTVILNIFDGYIDTGEQTGNVGDYEFYKEKCCRMSAGKLPNCIKYTTDYKGGAGIDTAFYRGIYGDNTSFVAVSPVDGNCGTKTVEQILAPVGCCEGVEPMEEVSVTPAVIPQFGCSEIVIEGGNGDNLWEVNEGFFMMYPNAGNSNKVCWDSDTPPCTSGMQAQVDITNDCNSMAVSVPSQEVDVPEVTIPQLNRYLSPGGYITITCSGGHGPYNWSPDGLSVVAGQGTTIVTLLAKDDFCGTASVSVSARCGGGDSCKIASTRGEWVDDGPSDDTYCDISGACLNGTSGNVVDFGTNTEKYVAYITHDTGTGVLFCDPDNEINGASCLTTNVSYCTEQLGYPLWDKSYTGGSCYQRPDSSTDWFFIATVAQEATHKQIWVCST